MTNIDPDQASVSDIRAVTRVGNICALFGPQVSELTAADIAERTGLNRTTAYRYCASMVAAGILERGSKRGMFALGAMMVELGLQALGRDRLLEIAGPHLRKLSAAVQMTAVLSLPGTNGPVVALVAEEPSQQVLVTVRVGTKLEASAAQSRVLLAYESEHSIDDTDSGPSAADRARLDEVRRDGHIVVRPGGTTFVAAAPVFDRGGIRATVAFLGVGDVDLTSAIEELRAAARSLSEALGAPQVASPSADR